MAYSTKCICKRCGKVFDGWSSEYHESKYCNVCQPIIDEEEYQEWLKAFKTEASNLDLDKVMRYIYELANKSNTPTLF